MEHKSENLSYLCNGPNDYECQLNSSAHTEISEERMKYIHSVVNTMRTLGGVIGITAVLLNLVFLCALSNIKKKDRPHQRFIKSLSISDIFGAISFIAIMNLPHGYLGVIAVHDSTLVRALPYVIRSAPWMFYTAYLLTLSCLTMNQYFAVCKPWNYMSLARYKRVNISLIFIWFVSSLHVTIPLVIILGIYIVSKGKGDAMPVLHRLAGVEILMWMLIFTGAIVFNICTTLVIYKKLCNLQLRSRTVCNSRLINVPPTIKKKQEAFVTLFLLLLASIFCRLPFPIIGIIGYSAASKIDYGTWEIINRTLAFLLYVNFLVDPVIYFVRIKDVRRGLERWWRWLVLKVRQRSDTYLQCNHGNNRVSSSGIMEQHEMKATPKFNVDSSNLQSSSTPMNFNDICFNAF